MDIRKQIESGLRAFQFFDSLSEVDQKKVLDCFRSPSIEGIKYLDTLPISKEEQQVIKSWVSEESIEQRAWRNWLSQCKLNNPFALTLTFTRPPLKNQAVAYQKKRISV